MAVRLEGSIKRWIGLSTDTKPGADGELIPSGSSFLETDSGRIFRYDGAGWAATPPADEPAPYLAAMLLELRELRELLTLAFAS